MRGPSILLFVTLLGTLAAWSRRADASPSSRLLYARGPGAESCPDEDVFRKEVAARLGYDPFFPWAPRTVSVEIEVVDGRSRARVVIVDERGFEQGSQTIEGSQAPIASCTGLVRAAALAVSVSLDATPAPPPPPPPDPEPAENDGTPSLPIVAPLVEKPPQQRAETLPLRPARRIAKRKAVLSLAPQVWLGYGQWPVVTAGVGAAVDVRYGRWALALEGRWDAPSTIDLVSSEQVQLQRATGSLVPCAHVSVLALCAVASFGETMGQGVNVLDPTLASAFYAAFGGRVGLDVPLGGRFRWQLLADVEGIATPMHLVVGGSDHFDSGPIAASFGTSLAMSIF